MYCMNAGDFANVKITNMPRPSGKHSVPAMILGLAWLATSEPAQQITTPAFGCSLFECKLKGSH